MNKHWQDWGNLVLGVWVFISPWVLQQVMATGGEAASAGMSNAATWNLYVVGIAVAAVAGAALLAFRIWEEWINLALGAWLFASPWLLGFSSSALLMWNAVIVGGAVVILASLAIAPTQGSMRGPTTQA